MKCLFLTFSFISILGSKKYNESKASTNRRQSNRLQSPLSSPSSAAWVYPKECNICSGFRVQHKRRKYEPYKISTHNAEQTIKAAAKDKDPELFNEIQQLDLIAKEFKFHKSGYAISPRLAVESTEQTDVQSSYDHGKFEEVIRFVEDEIIGLGRAISMKVIHNIYELGVDDSRYTSKLKQRLQNHFKDRTSFLTPKEKACDIVIPKSCLDASAVHYDITKTVEAAATHIREEILKKTEDLPEVNWPPSIEKLSDPDRTPVKSFIKFLESLIYLEGHRKSPSPNLARIVNSFAQDITGAVTRGKQIQKKQILLGLGLHSLTGSRKVIDIIHKLGHSISYNTVCEIETAQAECALVASKSLNVLALQPTLPDRSDWRRWINPYDSPDGIPREATTLPTKANYSDSTPDEKTCVVLRGCNHGTKTN